MANSKIGFMKKILTFIGAICLCLLSCSIKRFVAKSRQVDFLPKLIASDSIRIINPAFSGYSVSGNRIELAFPVFIGKQNVFKNQFINLLDSKNIALPDNFIVISDCLTNKIHAENWRDEKWDSVITYSCLKTDSLFYNVLFYNRFDVYEPGGYSTIPQNKYSDMYSLLIIFHRSKIVYSRNFRYLKRLSNKEQKAMENGKDYPFFKDNQIKYIVERVTEDLFNRIKAK